MWSAIGIILALIVVLSAYVGYPIYVAIQKSQILMARALPYAHEAPGGAIRILVAGDSTGVGVGATDPRDSIAGRIGTYYPNASIENISVTGSTLKDLRTALETVTQRKYDLIVLQIGANDITGLTSYSHIRSSLAAVIERTETLGKRTLVLTAGNVGSSPVFRWPLSSFLSHRTRIVRGIFTEEIAKHPAATYVDLFQEREDDMFLINPEKYFASDFFHPSSDGYGLWYERVQPLLPTL